MFKLSSECQKASHAKVRGEKHAEGSVNAQAVERE